MGHCWTAYALAGTVRGQGMFFRSVCQGLALGIVVFVLLVGSAGLVTRYVMGELAPVLGHLPTIVVDMLAAYIMWLVIYMLIVAWMRVTSRRNALTRDS